MANFITAFQTFAQNIVTKGTLTPLFQCNERSPAAAIVCQHLVLQEASSEATSCCNHQARPHISTLSSMLANARRNRIAQSMQIGTKTVRTTKVSRSTQKMRKNES
eukprot:4162789-Amphidinium_carterae.2